MTDPATVRVLAVSDEVDDALLVGAPRPDVDVVVACGDLPFDYLAGLMEMTSAPLVFVPGNHDADVSGYRTSRAGLTVRAGFPDTAPWPAGAVNADGRVVDVAGLRIAGLGGCLRYREGPNQYTERQQRRRAGRVARRVRRAQRGPWTQRVGWGLRARSARRRERDRSQVDLLLTHAPPLGVGDGPDRPHRGFAAHTWLVGRLRPRLLLHGHVHPYGQDVADRAIGSTVVRNVVGGHVFDVPLPMTAGPTAEDRAS